MDYLTSVGLEPQLAIPVVGVVLFAVLVYIFGFQKSEEPSYEHLAVLQSNYKPKTAINLKQKSSSLGSAQGNKTAKAKDKPVSNGHVVHQDKEKSSGGVKGKAKEVNKENKPPQTPKTTAANAKKDKKTTVKPPADFEEGDWIQAPSRKDKKNKVKKEEPTKIVSLPVKKTVENKPIEDNWENAVLKEVDTSQVQNQTTQTTPTISGVDKKSVGTAGSSSVEVSPKKQPKKVATLVEAKIEPEPVKVMETPVEAQSDAKENASPVKVVKESVQKAPPAVDLPTDDPKNNIAFDELGDTWEEAKSRGTKKRRARKD